MKKIMTLMAIAITMPLMASNLQDDKTCREMRDEYNGQVSRLKSEIGVMKKNTRRRQNTT